MLKTKAAVFLALLLVMGLTGSLAAEPIPVTNSRPVPVNITAGEPSLQSLLNTMWGDGTFNAVTDQNSAAIFKAVGNVPFANNFPVLAFENSGVEDSHVFGIWTGFDTTGPITRVPIFFGGASPTATAMMTWLDQDTVKIQSFDPGVNTGTFDGINKDFFGFYYDAFGTPLYTVDALNPVNTNGNRADALTYNFNNIAWTFAFDDGQVDCDYNDLVVKVESISPVPIPGAILLFGTGLFRLIGMRRRQA
jgi:hypothetical protein